MAEWDSGVSDVQAVDSSKSGLSCFADTLSDLKVERGSTCTVGTKETVRKIPLLKASSGPRDKAGWETRLKEELKAIITCACYKAAAQS